MKRLKYTLNVISPSQKTSWLPYLASRGSCKRSQNATTSLACGELTLPKLCFGHHTKVPTALVQEEHIASISEVSVRLDETGLVLTNLAPSWSWASVDGPVHMTYKSQFRDSIIDILQAEIQPLHGDMFGQIESGHMALTGTLCAMGTFAEVFDQIWDGEFENDFTFGIDDYENVVDDEDVYLLPLASGQLDLPSLHGRAEKPRFFSLLVQQDETTDGRLAYRRLGFVIVDNEGNATGSTFHCPNWTPPSLGSSLNSEIILV